MFQRLFACAYYYYGHHALLVEFYLLFTCCLPAILPDVCYLSVIWNIVFL